MPRLLFSLLAVLILMQAGCAVVGVKVQKNNTSDLRRDALELAGRNSSSKSAAFLVRAQDKNLSESARAAAFLEAARLSDQNSEQGINLAATRGILALMAARGFSPLPLEDGRILEVSTDTALTLDPRLADAIVPAADIRITKMRDRAIQQGTGLPCVAHFPPKSAALRNQAGVPTLAGLCEPVTALMLQDSKNPRIVFYRTAAQDDVILGGRRVKLAADFSAPLAYMLSKGRNRNIDVGALLRADKNFDQTGLYQFSRFDPKKIPVVFVHGLLSRPETWVPAVNGLLADEKIRERYQFWFFLYPTGLPVWGTAAELRSELDRFRQAFDPARQNPNFDRMVLVGHSMGGLVSSLQIRSGGEALWRQFMNTPPEKLSLSPAAKNRIVEVVEFQPRPEVSRVVFFSTPHRGSRMAVNPFTEFASKLIRLPFDFLDKDHRTLREALRDEFRELFVAPANSLVFLRANSPLLESILNLPTKKGVPFHSIVGDRGKGDAPNSSDGVVPYWSSKLEGAESEKIVPSGHGSHEHPEGIAELARILRKHR
ncbi:MAG: esterase/lipase family protein [Verrucomicrobiota bacterium]